MSIGNEKFLSDMREAVKAAMEAEPYFFDISIVTERLQNIDGKVDALVGKSGGLAIVLVTPALGGVLVNVRGANFAKIQFVARIFENTKTNPTGKEALNVAIYLAAFWSQLKPDALTAALKLDDAAVTLGNDPRFLCYDVGATTEGGTQIAIPQLGAVSVDAPEAIEAEALEALDGGTALVLAPDVPGAAIFCTLDMTPPAPRNPSAFVYTAPFPAASGSTLRARAWLAGYLPSAELKVIL